MRYYSDELKKFFDTEEALLSAEEVFKEKKEKAKETKAQLAKAIEEADKKVDNAYALLEAANKEVEKLKEEYNKKIVDILTPARKEVKECNAARAKAIQNFTSKYGVYTTTYTGDKATKEFNKLAESFDKFFKFPLWF